MREDGSKPQPGPGLRQGPTGILLSSWVSPFHLLLQLQFCISVPEYLSLFVLAKNQLLKLCSPILASRTGIPYCLPGNSWQLVCSARESSGDAVAGESFVPGWVSLSHWQAASVGFYLLPVRTKLSHLERWTVVARPCLEILQETTESPPWGPTLHENLESLQPHSQCPRTTPHIPQSNSRCIPAAEFHAHTNPIPVPKPRARSRFWGSSKVKVS